MRLASSKLRTLRETAGLTRDALAEKSGISKSMIKLLETTDDTNPLLATVTCLAAALGVELDELLEPNGEAA